MKFCGICGAQMPDEAVTCSNCGTHLPASKVPQHPDSQQQTDPQINQPPVIQQTYQQPYQQTYGQTVYLNAFSKGKAVAGLVCGIVGLVFSFFAWMSFGITALLGLALCIVGMVFSVKARNEIPLGVPGRGMATAGLVCGIVGAVLSGIIAVCSVCVLGCAACAEAGAFSSNAYSNNWYCIFFL